MAHDVLMPQLGMAQDTAVLLSWAKAVGDPVKTGDILMEVETDKTTVEVEAAHDGFIVDIRVPAGSDVPVGDVIAIISDKADDAVNAIAQPDATTTAIEASSIEPASQKTGLPASIPVTIPVQREAPSGKILASPKAKIEAKRRNLNLKLLADSGVQQPIRYVDVLEANIAASPVDVAALAVQPSARRIGLITAKTAKEPVQKFLNWLSKERDNIPADAIWLAFVSRALRASGIIDKAGELQGDYRTPTNTNASQSALNADQAMLSLVQLFPTDEPGQFSIYDLQETSISRFEPASLSTDISLVLTSSRKNMKIDCYYQDGDLSSDEALRFATVLTQLLSNPIQLLI